MTFFFGLSVQFSCVVVVHPAVDTGVIVQGSLEMNGTRLQDSDDDRITVNNNFMQTSSESNIFQIIARISSLNFDDTGTYSCSATVTQQPPRDYIIAPQSSAENQRAITVQGIVLCCEILKCIYNINLFCNL